MSRREDPTNPAFRLPPDGEPGDRHDWAATAARVIRMERELANIRKTWARVVWGILTSLMGIVVLAISVLVQIGAYRERVDTLVDVTARLDQRIERLIYLQMRGSDK